MWVLSGLFIIAEVEVATQHCNQLGGIFEGVDADQDRVVPQEDEA